MQLVHASDPTDASAAASSAWAKWAVAAVPPWTVGSWRLGPANGHGPPKFVNLANILYFGKLFWQLNLAAWSAQLGPGAAGRNCLLGWAACYLLFQDFQFISSADENKNWGIFYKNLAPRDGENENKMDLFRSMEDLRKKYACFWLSWFLRRVISISRISYPHDIFLIRKLRVLGFQDFVP